MTSLASALVRRYPLAWRERYEAEVLALLEDSPPGLRDLLELTRGLLVERVKSWVEPGEHPYLSWMLLRARWSWIWTMLAVALVGSAGLIGEALALTLGPAPDVVLNATIALSVVTVPAYYGRLLRCMWRTAPILRPADWLLDVFPRRWASLLTVIFLCSSVVFCWSMAWSSGHWVRWVFLQFWVSPVKTLIARGPAWTAVSRQLEDYMGTIEGLASVDWTHGSNSRDRRVELEARRHALRVTLDSYGYRARFRKS